MFPTAVPVSGFLTFNARIVPKDASIMPIAFLLVNFSLRNEVARMIVNIGPVDCKILLIGAEAYTMPVFCRLIGIVTPNKPRRKKIPMPE